MFDQDQTTHPTETAISIFPRTSRSHAFSKDYFWPSAPFGFGVL